MRNEARRVAHRWLLLSSQWREAGSVRFIQILHLNEEQSTSVPLGSWQQPMDQSFHQDFFFFFFRPAGSQRQREVVASLSKHAATQCFAKTPRNFLITSQFKRCQRQTAPPVALSQPSSHMAHSTLKCCSTDLQHRVARIFQPPKLLCLRLQTIASTEDIAHALSRVVSAIFHI